MSCASRQTETNGPPTDPATPGFEADHMPSELEAAYASILLSLDAMTEGCKEFLSEFRADPLGSLRRAGSMEQSRMVDVVAGLGMTLLIAGVVVNYVAQLDVIQNSTGPLADEMDQVITFIGIGFTLGALAIIAYAGRTAISFFQGGR